MPTLNEETGFYRGNPGKDKGQTYTGECVPVAVANYLLLHEIPKDTIENVLNDMIESPEYDKVGGEVSTLDVPELVERALRTHVNKDIQVALCGAFEEGTVPDEKKSHVKCVPVGTTMTAPFIALSGFEGQLQHLWVATDNLPERIDNDGKVHESLRPIGGYLEIKGL